MIYTGTLISDLQRASESIREVQRQRKLTVPERKAVLEQLISLELHVYGDSRALEPSPEDDMERDRR
jgi:hypothetical protein